MDDLGLCEFDKSRPSFSFSNNSSPPILCRIDKFLANIEWFEMFPGLVEKSFNFYDSDHRFLLLKKCCPIDGGPKPFRFQPHWFEEKKLMEYLQAWWEETRVTGNADYVFHRKLKLLKDKIKHMVKENLGKVEKKTSSPEGLLLDLECEEEDRLLIEKELEEKHHILLDLKDALKSEDILLSRKACSE